MTNFVNVAFSTNSSCNIFTIIPFPVVITLILLPKIDLFSVHK